jgi:signal transduction histidine kinase
MSIRSRLLLLVLLATLLPALLVAARFFIDREAQIDSAVGSLSALANDFAEALGEKIRGTVQLSYGLARARDLDTTDRAACSAFLSAVREEYPQYTGILTINPDGRLFCDSLRTGRELDLRDRRYFQQASRGPADVALEPVFGRLTNIGVLQIAYAVRAASGELRFVLLASLNLEKFVQDRAVRGVEILVIDSEGTVLAGAPSDHPARKKGASIKGQPMFTFAAQSTSAGAREVAETGGNRHVWAVAGSPELREAGLHLLVGQAKSDLVAAANRRFAEDMAVLAVLAAFLFLGVWVLAELAIRRQVLRIASMAKQLGAGNLQARIPPPHPGGELGGLMTVLNGAAESLERQRVAIEELDQKLHQSQKMEAVGQLTGGVAHDFNNLLTVIIGTTEFLADKLAAQPELRELADSTMKAAERGAELTRNLLAFARRQPLEPKTVDVNRQLLGMEDLLRRTLGEHIDCRFALGQQVWPATVDPTQLETAILNLVLNARDAMPKGGRLTVETGNEHLDAAYAAQNDEVRVGQYVFLAVADSGSGMRPDVVARAFEPFFTTKDVGKGTGLGLSMVYGFVKQSGGHIKIHSEVGQGTIVKLYLPRSDATPPAAKLSAAVDPAAHQNLWRAEQRAAAAVDPAAEQNLWRADQRAPRQVAAGGGETILAVEDDDLVRAHVAAELKGLGYAVLIARDGAEALEMLRGPAAIDLLFTDVVMPGGMSGPELAQLASQLRPGLKVLFTSGYTENTVIHEGRLDPGVLLLNKPYRRPELALKLRAALGGA